MSHWESSGKSSDWYTPKYIFDALGETFDIDAAAPYDNTRCHVPCRSHFWADALQKEWNGFVWLNPPFGGRNGITPWLKKFFAHGNGIALSPDRTSAPWWQEYAPRADAILFVAGKIRFLRPDGSEGTSPSNGTTLLAAGDRAEMALRRAATNGLGFVTQPIWRLAKREVAA
jgi:DNA N-6-adenine-methyltransferase (Dam)